jgi:nardilysin
MKMEEPCFDILRTREQLGYEVYNTLRNTNGILAFLVVVKAQASKHT